jgi:hypothetical protein
MKNYRAIIDKNLSLLDDVEMQLSVKQTEYDKLLIRVNALAECHELLKTFYDRLLLQLHGNIEEIVNRGLAAVFPDPYTFKIRFEEMRNQIVARICFVRNGIELNPLTCVGYGCIDVTVFLLRLAVLYLTHRSRQLIVLDEPFRYVSAEYRPKLYSLVQQLSQLYQVQFIIVTHDSDLTLIADTVISL